MNKIVNTKIEENGKKVFLVFEFPTLIKLDLTSDNQETIKDIFSQILEAVIENEDIEFQHITNENNLFDEVAIKYIGHLNNEIKAIKSNYLNPKKSKYKEQ